MAHATVKASVKKSSKPVVTKKIAEDVIRDSPKAKAKNRGIHDKLKPIFTPAINVDLPAEFQEKALRGAKLPPAGQGIAHIPTPESRLRICKLVAFGMTRESIMGLERLDDVTLYKHYRYEMDLGAEYITYLIANSLMQQALGGNVTAQMYYLSRRAKWTETVNHNHSFTNSITEGAKLNLIGKPDEEDSSPTKKR